MSDVTVLIVPGLRDHVSAHWQTLLEAKLCQQGRKVASVPPMGREDLDCQQRVDAIEQVARGIEGPFVIVAHSGGCIMVSHWAQQTRCKVQAALLATPPDFERPMPEGYPSLEALHTGGWLPVPRQPLPFSSVVVASRNDPLAGFLRVEALARDWGSVLMNLGEVGHLNPASGYGEWPVAEFLIDALATRSSD